MEKVFETYYCHLPLYSLKWRFHRFFSVPHAVTAILMGWGLTSESTAKKELQKAELPVITTEACQRRHGHVFYGGRNNSEAVTDSMLCTGFLEGGTGGCYYYSGMFNDGV